MDMYMLYAEIVSAESHVMISVIANIFMFKIHRQYHNHGDVLERYMFMMEDQQLEMAHPQNWD